MLPERENQMALLMPSALPGHLLHDRMRCLRCVPDGQGRLRLIGTLPAGLYEMAMVTRPGTFPTDTLMLHLTEWPSGRTVEAGPSDFDHTTYRMTVPTFRVTVNGRNWGLVWCEVPSPDDMAARRIRAVWGFEVTRDGPVNILLEVSPDDRMRLSWEDVAQMDLCVDNRTPFPLPESLDLARPHPRLMADEDLFRGLADEPDAVQRGLLAGLREQIESGRDGTYGYRTATLALLGRVEADRSLIDEAIRRTLALCERTDWGYHGVPEIMGWNNDRDAGNRMLESALVSDWLHDELTPEQRERIAAKLAHHADIAYRVTVLQKNYWYYRCMDAHGQGLWTGLAAAAIALLGRDDRAPGWLAWAAGNLDDALRHMPEDGVSAWPVFNVIWHVLNLALLEGVLGRMPSRYPFIEAYAHRVPQLPPEHGGPMLPTLLLALARRHVDASAQASALARLHREGEDAIPSHRCTPFALLFYDSSIQAGEAVPQARAGCTRGGTAFCRADEGACFSFVCGSPATARHHASLNWINRVWCGIGESGSFSWSAPVERHGRNTLGTIVPLIIRGYSKRTGHANLITVDGAGHYLHGRWLGSALPLGRVPFIERFATVGGASYCAANLTPAYADDAGVLSATRTWVFLHEPGVVVMRDRVMLDRPRTLAWRIHGVRGEWHASGPARFRLDERDTSLTVSALACMIDGVACAPASLNFRCDIPQRVPTYTSGLNQYKTASWQPELRPEQVDIPPYSELRIEPQCDVESWELVTAMGLKTDPSELAQQVLWPDKRSVLRLGDGRTLSTDVAVCTDKGLISFETTSWHGNSATVRYDIPRDLLWEDASGPPQECPTTQ